MTVDFQVPFWGEPALLRLTVDSVLAQENPDWRLTVIDDCYPDPAAAAWVAGIDDPRVRFHRNEHNLGVLGNFRECVARATGAHLVVLGCDDVLLPNYVDVVTNAFAQYPDATIVQPGVEVIDEFGRPCQPLADRVKALLRPRGDHPRLLGGERLAAGLMHGDWLYWPSLAIRTDAIQRVGFRDAFAICLDLALIMDLLGEGAQLLYEPSVAFRYRRHSASASAPAAHAERRLKDEERFFQLVAAQFGSLGWKRARRAARLHLTSRLHAAAMLPLGVSRRDPGLLAAMVKHMVRPPLARIQSGR